MIEQLLAQDQALIRAKINTETAMIQWRELQRFFAAGKVLVIDQALDLVDTAFALQQDDVGQIQSWTEQSLLQHASDEQARNWHENDRSLWAVVVKPWVLVQTRSPHQTTEPESLATGK